MMMRCTYFTANNHGALPEYQAIYQNNTAVTSSSKQLSKRKSKNGGHSALQGCFHSALFKHCAGAFVILPVKYQNGDSAFVYMSGFLFGTDTYNKTVDISL